MTDIDFDELDKAVTSLMGKAVSTDPDDIVQEKNLTISSTLKPGEKPMYDKLGEVARGIGSETILTEGERTVMGDSKLPPIQLPEAELEAAKSLDEGKSLPVAPVVAPAAKRPMSGRAMDVVRSSPSKRAPVTMPSLVTPERLSSLPSTVAKDAPQPQKELTSTLPENNDAQRLTPFLPDTKVEKRPLGSSNESKAPSGPVESPFTDTTDLPTDEVSHAEPVVDDATVVTPYADKPANDDQKTLDASTIDSKLSPEEQKLLEIESAEVKEDTPTAESVRAVESGDTEKLSNGSISQQYQVKPAQSADDAGAIYDVKDYHQALAHPKKQKSGWGTVLLILIIIVACATIGAAVYFILGAGL